MSTSLMLPKRGGLYPIYGVFMGGSELTNNYTLKSSIPYELITQLRNPKKSSTFERILISVRQSTTSVTFKGNINTSSNCTNEYNKEGFITALEDQVAFYGLQKTFDPW